MEKGMTVSVGFTGLTALALALVAVFDMPAALAYSDYVWGEASVTEATAQEYEGYWKYCISIGWDVSEYTEGAHGASHVSLVLELEECLADCGDVCFAFPDTVGMGEGVDGCGVYFYAELDIKGDPTVPAESPTVKFEPYTDACEPDVAGTANVCFYSLIPPEAVDPEGAPIWIKFGPYTEEGLITGTLPSCEGTAAIGHSTWSSIKRLFR
jgi:hypothetical protein